MQGQLVDEYKADEIKSGGGWAKTHSDARGIYKEHGKLSRRLAELKQQVQSLEAQVW